MAGLGHTAFPESRPSIDKISLFSIPIMVVGSAELDREVRTGHHISHIILKVYFVVSICQLIIMWTWVWCVSKFVNWIERSYELCVDSNLQNYLIYHLN